MRRSRTLGISVVVIAGVIVAILARRCGGHATSAPASGSGAAAPLASGAEIGHGAGIPVLAGPCRIAGTVLAAGKPVPATIALRDEASGATLAAQTDATGHFDLGQRASSDYVIAATARGSSPAFAKVECGHGADRLELFLARCDEPAHGSVADASGGAIVGATIASQGIVLATSDRAGRFELCTGSEVKELEARAEGYAPLVHAYDGLQDLELALVPEAILAVRVVDAAGQPVTGAHVTAQILDPPWESQLDPWDARTYVGPGAGVTAGDGRVELRGRPAEQHLVVASLDARFSAPITLELVAGQTRELTLTLGAPSALRGRLVLEGGGVAADVRMSWVGQDGDQREVRSGADGAFVLAGVTVKGALYPVDPYYTTADDRTPAGGGEPIEIEVGKVGAIRGRVTLGGKPVGGARVAISNGSSGLTRADGTFSIWGVRVAGRVLVTATSAELGAAGEATLDLEPGVDREGVEIELAANAGIRGVIVDQAGAPVAAATIELRSKAPDAGSAISGRDGRFAVTQLRGGSYTPWVRLAGISLPVHDGAAPLEVAPGGQVADRKVVVEVTRGEITGDVADHAGRPAADAVVRLSDQRMVHTGADGSFRLATIGDGPFTVEARSGNTRIADRVDAAPGAHLHLVLHEPGAFHVTCTGDVAAASLQLTARDGGYGRRVECGETVSSLREGGYTLSAFYSSVDVHITEGTTAEVAIEIQPRTVLEIVLRAREPLSGKGVCEVTSADESSSLVVFRDHDKPHTFEILRGRGIKLACKVGVLHAETSIDATGPTLHVELDLAP